MFVVSEHPFACEKSSGKIRYVKPVSASQRAQLCRAFR
nr:MAG TPA: hypothetical protein [Caudoviricetes sp.]